MARDSSPVPDPVASGADPLASAAWLHDALAHKGASRFFDVDGVRLHALEWNAADSHKPPLLFAHGFVGHAHWWDFIAPFFARDWRVAAVELSGMGESGRRPHYDELVHSRDLLGAIDALGMAPATVVAHSYAGSRTLRAALERPEAIAHALLIDSHIHFPDLGPVPLFQPLPVKVYPTYEAARSRFRLHPPQPETHPVLVEHVARHSLKPVDGGWTWKFDPTVGSFYEVDGASVMSKLRCRVDYLYGAESLVVDAARAARIVACLPNPRRPVAIPGAHHHVMLDQPLALVAALRALLA